jgi:uncharacterized protein YegP (UPF0339 family)
MWRYDVYADTTGKYRWRLRASNGRKVATSGESFASRSNAARAATNFKQQVRGWEYEIYPDRAGNYRWRALSGNGQKVASSGESFDSRPNAKRSVDNVRQNGGSAAGP